MSRMDRTEFMSLVYDELQSDGDNNRANRIIDAADEYAESMMPRWIPVAERLPEEDSNVLVSYCYKEGEGDTSHSNIAITSYGHMYFGGNKVGIHHWRAPFKYFHNNYEVIAWMPLPEPYREEEQDATD
jgi:hypothetical protein